MAGQGVLAIAAHEVRQLGAAFSSKTTRYGLAAGILLLVLAWPAIQERGIHPEAGLYPIEVEPGAAYGPAAAADASFRMAAPGERPVLVLAGASVAYDPASPASKAAAQQLREAVRKWQEAELGRESDEAAAFPISVNLIFQPRDLSVTTGGATGSGAGGDAGAGAGAGAGTGAGSGGTGEVDGAGGPDSAVNATAPLDLLAATNGTARQQASVRPADVQPPFPVRSLLLTFAYLIPLNFLAQLYAGSLLSERIRDRGLLVLSAPLSPAAILFGRSLPYVAAGAVVYVASSAAIGAAGLGWLAAAPIVLFVLVAALVLGNVARSPRELTFLLTGTTTLFSTFLFLPAVFSALPPVAFLSPVSVIAASIQGEAVTWGQFLYATVPLSLSVGALAFVGFGLYREETLFSQASLPAKLGAAVGRWTHSRRGLLAAGILAVPFALALEMFVLALFIPLGLAAAFPAFIVGAAILEESLKLLATASQRRIPGWKAGLWVGAGFFVGEKLALLVGLAGLGALDLGDAMLRVLGARGGWLLLLGPLLLHMAASSLAGLGVGRARAWAWLAWLAAVLVHGAYNVAVITAGGAL